MTRTHLIIPCTANKSLGSNSCLELSQVARDDLEESLKAWLELCEDASELKRADELYRGQAFKRLKVLSQDFGLKLHIMSAGFGLVPSETPLPNYNATFSPGENSVPLPTSEWWRSITSSCERSTSLNKLVGEHPGEHFIICASNEYLKAIQEDLRDTFENLESTGAYISVVAINVPQTLKPYESSFLKVSNRIFNHPRCSTFGLSKTAQHVTSMATCLLVEALSDTKDTFDAIIARLKSEIAALEKPESKKRQPQDDEFIRKFIDSYLEKSVKPSKTGVLREYRQSGYACEEKKLYRLYHNQLDKRKDIK
ncbi:DUF6884 domain-containing protein [Vibrio diabolicus]